MIQERPSFPQRVRVFISCFIKLFCVLLCLMLIYNFFCRASVSGRICHGGHRSRWHLSGHLSQWWCAAGGWAEEHPQTAGRGFLLREDLQTQWVSVFFHMRFWAFLWLEYLLHGYMNISNVLAFQFRRKSFLN